MRKPQNIILGIVGAAVAGGAVISGLSGPSRVYRSSSPRPTESWGTSFNAASQTLPDREYQNDEYIPSVGYYHAPNHAFYPYRWNYHDSARGYYHGGVWTAAALAASMLSSRPTPEELSRAREALARQRQQQQQANSSSSSRSGGSSFHYSGGSSYGRSSWSGGSSGSSGSSSHVSSGSHTSFGGFGSHGSSSS